MRKRVGLARAIIYEPQIVLYDEPTTGLDPIVSDSIDKLIMRVRDRLEGDDGGGHARHAQRAARGQPRADAARKKIYASGTPEEFFASQDPVVRQFIDGVADAGEGKILSHGKIAIGNSKSACSFSSGWCCWPCC
jgi:phospholipid/cholesterol/gamma-HCH transport system ATP-binding protein